MQSCDGQWVAVLERSRLLSNSVVLHGIEGIGAVVIDTGIGLHADQPISLLKRELGVRH